MITTFIQVVGVPVTLNGDLKNQFVETNVGFDTICKVLTSIFVKLRDDIYGTMFHRDDDIHLNVLLTLFFDMLHFGCFLG